MVETLGGGTLSRLVAWMESPRTGPSDLHLNPRYPLGHPRLSTFDTPGRAVVMVAVNPFDQPATATAVGLEARRSMAGRPHRPHFCPCVITQPDPHACNQAG